MARLRRFVFHVSICLLGAIDGLAIRQSGSDSFANRFRLFAFQGENVCEKQFNPLVHCFLRG
jgi:hypothetical protein